MISRIGGRIPEIPGFQVWLVVFGWEITFSQICPGLAFLEVFGFSRFHTIPPRAGTIRNIPGDSKDKYNSALPNTIPHYTAGFQDFPGRFRNPPSILLSNTIRRPRNFGDGPIFQKLLPKLSDLIISCSLDACVQH